MVSACMYVGCDVSRPPALYGQFYSGDSFIVLYEYKTPTGRDQVRRLCCGCVL